VKDGLGAVGRIFGDSKVCEDESGPGEQAKLDRGEADGAAERVGDEPCDAALIAADADPWRNEQGGKNPNDCGKKKCNAAAFPFSALSVVVH
jgi:hypothetical protein